MLEITILTIVFVITATVEFVPLFKQKKWKEIIISFILLSVSYILYILWIFDITIEPVSKIVGIIYKPMINLWNQLSFLCK
ncbi:hypothetical protein TKV_c19520 [Thermoanaerobacter kivui]|uniref:Uncharacterized protein n=1 Tax=Thermoanaerobacter kivui TaxID=2325 RepID=A0A097ATF9_THEKI|nr:hypothetical protein TKV_c19520 [Thermoanaerobacter kivui]